MVREGVENQVLAKAGLAENGKRVAHVSSRTVLTVLAS
jgi:hypothetical protein